MTSSSSSEPAQLAIEAMKASAKTITVSIRPKLLSCTLRLFGLYYHSPAYCIGEKSRSPD